MLVGNCAESAWESCVVADAAAAADVSRSFLLDVFGTVLIWKREFVENTNDDRKNKAKHKKMKTLPGKPVSVLLDARDNKNLLA